MSSREWIPLPVIGLAVWPPTDEEQRAWIDHYIRQINRDGADAVREAIEWEQREEHPYIRNFHLACVDAAIEESKRPVPGWEAVDDWTRQDFIDRVRQDQDEHRSGSKESIAQRVHLSPTALWRRWERVRKAGERWPSGNKGPTD